VGTLIALTFLLTLGRKGGDSGGSAGEKQVTNKDPKEPTLTPTGLLMERSDDISTVEILVEHERCRGLFLTPPQV
jgi:hypothetical protein